MRINDNNLVTNYNKMEPVNGGGIDYCLHELAHFVVLFKRAPQILTSERVFMQKQFDAMTCGRAQLHELRVIKLQHEVLGTSSRSILKSVMSGIREAAYFIEPKNSQKDIVTSEAAGMRLIKDIHISPRLISVYEFAIERFSLEPVL